MKNRIWITITLLLGMVNGFSQGSCVNGNLENGNLLNWIAFTGNRTATSPNVNVSNLTIGSVPGRHTIMTQGFDPEVGGNLLRMVDEGNHSVRLGNSNAMGEVDQLRYTFTVDPSNVNFSFRYAMVLEDNGHLDYQQPFLSYHIFEGTVPTPMSLFWGMNKQFIADLDDPYFEQGPNIIVWKDWQTECINLTKFLGKEVTIMFTVADCSKGGHFGYAYLDGICTGNEATAGLNVPSQVCYDEPIIANGTSSVNEDDYYFSVQQSDANWNTIGTEYSRWFIAEEAGVIDIKAFMASLQAPIYCNTYYRVKLAVRNCETEWDEQTRLVYIRCPDVQMDDVYGCCDGDMVDIYPPGTLRPPINPPYLYSWENSPDEIDRYYLNDVIGVEPTHNQTFTLTATDKFGCSRDFDVNLWVLGDFHVSIEQLPSDNCCSTVLKANIHPGSRCWDENMTAEDWDAILSFYNFEWSNGATTQSIIVTDEEPTDYTVTVSAADCYSHSANHTFTPPDGYNNNTVYDTPLIAPNAFTPNGDGLNDWFQIQEYGPNAPQNIGDPNAYDIVGYRLIVFDRWGQIEYDYETPPEQCSYNQGDIQWNGRNNDGVLLPVGTYVYLLFVKTCNGAGTTWHQICHMVGAGDPYANAGNPLDDGGLCLDYSYVPTWGWPPWEKVCDEFWDPESVSLPQTGQMPGLNLSCIFSVTIADPSW